MIQWAALTVDVAASIFLTEYWTKQRWPRVLRLLLSVLAAGAVDGLCLFVWNCNGFGPALLIGQAVGVVWDLLVRNKRNLGRLLCLDAGLLAAFLPLSLAESVSDGWTGAFYQALVFLCIAITPMSMGKRSETTERPSADEEIGLRPWTHKTALLPCLTWIPAVLFWARSGSNDPILCSVILLLFAALAMLLQREIDARMSAETLNRAMSRWQQESREYMNTIRSQRHDLNLHLHAITGLIHSGQYEECCAYVEKMVAQANDVNDIMPIRDPVVGSLLYTMREEARRRGSDITYYITYDMEDVLCNGFECNKVIGNLLQNAIDALESPEDKAHGIILRILKRRGNTVILCENRYTGDPTALARAFETGYSTKKGHTGIGLSMVARTVERYGGRIYPEFEGDVLRFVVNIPNRVRLPEGETDE